MHWLNAITFCIVATNINCQLNENEAFLPRPTLTDTRIVGGKAVKIQDVPYQISLLYNNKHTCGGSLLSHNLVITAAHCVHNRDNSKFKIRTGSSYIGEGGTVVRVKKITPHPKYNARNIDYDFALVELDEYNKKDVIQSYINLPKSNDNIKDGSMLLVSGWGSTQSNNESNKQLRAVSVPKFNQRRCGVSYAAFGGITDRMLCAGYDRGGKDACQGDSGGPLVDPTTKTLVGVVSWGYGCASPRYPGVYSKVSSVRGWIKNIGHV